MYLRKIVTLLLVFVLVIGLVTATGCLRDEPPATPAPDADQTKPMERKEGKTAEEKADNATEKSPTVAGATARAEDVAESATKVDGVKRAYVVVIGNTALIGLDVDKDIEAKQTTDLKQQVEKRVKKENKAIEVTSITADPNLVERIKRIADGIAEGKPLTSFLDEIAEILRRISPATNVSGS